MSIIARLRSMHVVIVVILLTIGVVSYSISSIYLPADNPNIRSTDEAPVQIAGTITLSGSEDFPTDLVVSNLSVLVNEQIGNTAPKHSSMACLKNFNFNVTVILDGERFDASSGSNFFGSSICKPIIWFQQIGHGMRESITNDVNSGTPKIDFPSTTINLDKYIYYPYPFDYFLSPIAAKVELSYVDSSNKVLEVKTISPAIDFSTNVHAWRIQMVNAPKWYYRNPFYSSEYFALWSRPTLPIVFCILVFIIILFTPIIIPFLNNRADILGTTFAFILGIWVFRETLLPNEKLLYGLMDYFFIGGCFLVITSMLLSFLIAPSKNESLPTMSSTSNSHPAIRKRKKRK